MTLLTSGLAAKRLGVTSQTIRRWAKVGAVIRGECYRLPFRAAGVHLRFRPEDVDEFQRLMTAAHDRPLADFQSLRWTGGVPAAVADAEDAALTASLDDY